MHTSDNNNNSIENALFHAAIQLSVPTVTSTDLIKTKFPTYSSTEEPPSTRKSKYSHLNKRKNLRDVLTQSSSSIESVTHKNSHHSNNIESKMTTAIVSTTNDYLTVKRYYQYSRSSSCSSRKNTVLGIWQELNHDEIPSSPLADRVKKTTPRWRTFSKVVASLLTFTRTKKERYEWIQLVGHSGTFKEGLHDGYVLKEFCEDEKYCYELLQNDILKEFLPKYNGIIQDEQGKSFIEMQDLLATFHEPCIMDCKIGVRTYLEEEIEKSEPRADLYNKMVAIDPLAPTEKENEEKKITKPRYMIWRESLSSTQDLGFRIEAIKKSRGLMSKEFHRIKQRDDVKKQFCEFIDNSLSRAISYLDRLIELHSTCTHSKFIQTHELIGSSILFVHDGIKASLWMIDFGKTRLLPNDIHITHTKPWTKGSHEDGYLLGLDNLISIFQEIIDELKLS